MKARVLYDGEADSLLVCREGMQSYASIRLGEIIVSLDKDFHVTAIEILNPDKLYKIPKKMLSKVSSANIQIQQRGPVVWIYIILKFEGIGESETLQVPLQLERPITV